MNNINEEIRQTLDMNIKVYIEEAAEATAECGTLRKKEKKVQKHKMALNINFNFTALKLSIYDSRKPIFHKAETLQLFKYYETDGWQGISWSLASNEIYGINNI